MSRRHYGRYTFETSNEDKILFPKLQLTKRDFIAYHEQVANRMVPHLRDRPLVLQRFPDGIDADGFYQKEAGDDFPDWITTVEVPVKSTGGTQRLVVCNNMATLAFLASRGCITLHPWLARVDRLDHPDLLVVDLDPSGDDFEPIRRAALWIRDLFAELSLPAFVKVTGSRGVHIAVPLDRSADFDTVRDFARSCMDHLAAQHADELTTEHRKDKRRGRLYLDVTRNAFGQTVVAPYSVRARPGAPVAVPIGWAELEGRRGAVGPRTYTVGNVVARIEGRSDPWESLRRRAHAIPPAAAALASLENVG